MPVKEIEVAHEYAKEFYASSAWRRCRDGYIKQRQGIDGGMCEECGEAAGYIVHHKQHITPETVTDPKVTLSWVNLEYVCKPCHERIHNYCGRQGSRREITFDASGNPTSPH